MHCLYRKRQWSWLDFIRVLYQVELEFGNVGQVKLEFGNVCFSGERKTWVPGKKLTECQARLLGLGGIPALLCLVPRPSYRPGLTRVRAHHKERAIVSKPILQHFFRPVYRLLSSWNCSIWARISKEKWQFIIFRRNDDVNEKLGTCLWLVI